jgi:homoserine kinase type II
VTSETETVRAAAARFGLEALDVARIPAGRMNRHWRFVGIDGRDYVLRRYTRERSGSAARLEHDVLGHLAARGWPVALPLESGDGETALPCGERLYAVFPLLVGEPAPPHNASRLRIQGRLLARLHRDLASFPMDGQRDGWGRIWEFDAGHETTFNAALDAFAVDHSQLAYAVRREKYRSLRELARLGYGELPSTLINFDFHRENLLYQRGALTGLLDLDSVHLDARVVDLAVTIANDCGEPPSEMATSPERAAAFVGGYCEHMLIPEDELTLIVPLLRAYRVWLLRRIVPRATGGDDRALYRIRRNVEQRLPALDARAADIERAVLAAAEAATRTSR